MTKLSSTATDASGEDAALFLFAVIVTFGLDGMSLQE